MIDVLMPEAWAMLQEGKSFSHFSGIVSLDCSKDYDTFADQYAIAPRLTKLQHLAIRVSRTCPGSPSYQSGRSLGSDGLSLANLATSLTRLTSLHLWEAKVIRLQLCQILCILIRPVIGS